jgi:FKBP-type peptidyl-prolyl cis-trans isomerase 2
MSEHEWYLDYRVYLDSGELAWHANAPLAYARCAPHLLDAFVEQVHQLAPGEETEVVLDSDETYGLPREDLVLRLPVAQAAQNLIPDQRVRLGLAPAIVSDVDDNAVTIDANHPLAGQRLRFEVRRLESVPLDLAAFVNDAPWRFAKTMPNIPHWYTVRGQTPEPGFEAVTRHILMYGYYGGYRGPANRGRPRYTLYWWFGNWKYWTMGAPPFWSSVINRTRMPAAPPWRWEFIEPEPDRFSAEETPPIATGPVERPYTTPPIMVTPDRDGWPNGRIEPRELDPIDVPLLPSERVLAAGEDATGPYDVRLSRYGVISCTCAEWKDSQRCVHVRHWAASALAPNECGRVPDAGSPEWGDWIAP